jgi:hypothetical protein
MLTRPACAPFNRALQGRLLDYLRCLECTQERVRSDAFLDVPLVISDPAVVSLL